MAFTQNPVATRVKQPQLGLGQIANNNITNQVTLMTAGANGSKVTAIILNNTDTAVRNIALWANNGASSFLVGTVAVPAGAGNGSIASISAFGNTATGGLSAMLPVDNDGQAYLFVPGSNTLQFATTSALTNNSVFIYGITVYADF